MSNQHRAALALGLCTFTLYAWWLIPGVGWLDTGELAAAGFSLGISHPPGQPGHTMLARLACFLPLGEIAFRIAVLSAASAALGSVGLFFLLNVVVGDKNRDPGTEITIVIACVLTALSPLMIVSAIRPEVYAPAFALIAWALVFAMRFVVATDDHPPMRHAFVATLLLALCASIHPMLAAACALPLAVGLVHKAGRRAVRLAPACVGLGLIGLCVLAYLPVRAGAANASLLRWGEPNTWNGFANTITASAYAGNFAIDGLASRTAAHLLLLGEGSSLALLFVGLVGLLFALVTGLSGARVLFAMLLLSLVGAAGQRVFYPQNPDIHGYLVPALIPLAIGVAVASAAAHRIARYAPVVVLAPVLLLASVGEPGHADRPPSRQNEDALWLHDQTIGKLPAGRGVYLTQSDHTFFPAVYERLVAGARPDVAIANQGLMRSSWFLRMVKRSLPELFVPFVDDQRKDRLAMRLLSNNLARHFVVAGEAANSFGFASEPVGLAFRYTRTPPVSAIMPTAPHFDGSLGEKIAAFTRLQRADYEVSRGRLLQAAQVANVLDRFNDSAHRALQRETTRRELLWRHLPDRTPVFIHAPWQDSLLASDLAHLAGLTPGQPPDDSEPYEVRLLFVWHMSLLGQDAGESLRALGARAHLETASMLEAHGLLPKAAEVLARVDANTAEYVEARMFLGRVLSANRDFASAETVLRQLLSDLPESARARPYALLGTVLAQQGRIADAQAAWRSSLAIDPEQPDVIGWLATPPPPGMTTP